MTPKFRALRSQLWARSRRQTRLRLTTGEKWQAAWIVFFLLLASIASIALVVKMEREESRHPHFRMMED